MVQASRGVRQESAPLRAMSNGIALLCKSFVSQLSTFLIALVSLCALEQIFDRIMVDWWPLPITNHDLH